MSQEQKPKTSQEKLDEYFRALFGATQAELIASGKINWPKGE